MYLPLFYNDPSKSQMGCLLCQPSIICRQIETLLTQVIHVAESSYLSSEKISQKSLRPNGSYYSQLLRDIFVGCFEEEVLTVFLIQV